MIIEKIIEALIGLAKGRLASRDTSRSRAARAFVRLYTSLVDCHEAYLQWKPNMTSVPIRRESYYAAWLQTVADLQFSFQKVENELRIFGPEVHEHVHSYLTLEVSESQASKTKIHELSHFLTHFVSDSSEPEAPSEVSEGEIEDAVKDDASYLQAEQLLRSFIAKEFKIEDIF